MRIWTGIEMEGKNKGLLTMFIESRVLGTRTVGKIIDLLEANPDVRAIYLGAGRVDLCCAIIEEADSLFSYCDEKGIMISYETSNLAKVLNNNNLLPLIYCYDIMVIGRADVNTDYDLSKILDKIVYKIDDSKGAYFTNFNLDNFTDITTVKNGLYESVDTLILED